MVLLGHHRVEALQGWYGIYHTTFFMHRQQMLALQYQELPADTQTFTHDYFLRRSSRFGDVMVMSRRRGLNFLDTHPPLTAQFTLNQQDVFVFCCHNIAVTTRTREFKFAGAPVQRL